LRREDLVAALQERRRQTGARKLPRPRRMLQPDGQRLAYFKALREGPLADMRRLLEERLIPVLPKIASRHDAARTDAVDDVGDVLDEITGELFAKWTNARLAQLVRPLAYDLAKFHRSQMIAVFRDYIGIDVIGLEPWLEKEVGKFVAENVALIKSIPSTEFAKIETMVARDVADGVRWEETAKDVRSRFSVSESRANLIARDQAGKFFGDLNKIRQEQLGVGRYTWRTMHDNRVRDEHEERDGKVYSWDKPPPDGHPGEAIQCRCFAEPDLSDVLGEALEGDPAEGSAAAEARVKPASARFVEPREPRAPKAPPMTPQERRVDTIRRKSEALAAERVSSRLDRVVNLQAELTSAQAQFEQSRADFAKLDAEVEALKKKQAELVAKATQAEKAHGFRSTQAIEAERAIEDFEKASDFMGALTKRREAREALENLQYRVEHGLPSSIRFAKLTDPQMEEDRKSWDAVQAEGKGPVRGDAAAHVEREFPAVAKALGGRLRVDDWTETTRRQLAEVAQLPPEMLAALKPHLGEIRICKETIRDTGRFLKLSDANLTPDARDSRTSYDQIGGVCSMSQPTGKIEAIVAGWCTDVMAHELSHALDGVARDDAGREASATPKFRRLWQRFLDNKDTLPNHTPINRSRLYYTEGPNAACETFAEAHAAFLTPRVNMSPEGLEQLRRAFPEQAARGDGYLLTAARFGTKIADYVEDRVKKNRWLTP